MIGTPAAVRPTASCEPNTIAPELTILFAAIVRAVKRPDRGSDYISRLMTLVAVLSLGVTVVCMVAVPLLLVRAGDLRRAPELQRERALVDPVVGLPQG